MFIKLLTIITACFVGGAKSPPTLHKQKQTNTIKETFVQRGNYDWTFYNRFNVVENITNSGGLSYSIDNVNNAVKLYNFSQDFINGDYSPYLEITLPSSVFYGHNLFFNWVIEPLGDTQSTYNDFLRRLDRSIEHEPFTDKYGENVLDGKTYLEFSDYKNMKTTDEFILHLNIIDLTTNPIPTFDKTMIELWTEKGLEEEVNAAIENTKNTNYPLYSMDFDYILSPSDITSDIPLSFRGDDYTHIYKSDLYNAINNRIGSVSNNFTIKIWLPIKNMRDLNIFAKGNNIKLLSSNGSIVYQYTQGNNIFDLTLPQDNRDFNFIELSFYDFDSINSNDIVLSVSNSVDYTSFQNGFDEGKKVGYEEGSKDGYIEGKQNGVEEGSQQGYEKGLEEGESVGYEKGYSDGISSKGFNPFTLLSTAFDSVSKLLSVNVFGGITLATLVSIPLMFLVVLFILKLMKG